MRNDLHFYIIITVYLFIFSFSIFCMITGNELYPFAPFKKYTQIHAGGFYSSEIIFTLKTGALDRLEWLHEYEEGILNTQIDRIYKMPLDKNTKFRMASNELAKIIDICRLNKKCIIFSNIKSYPLTSLVRLSSVQKFYRDLKDFRENRAENILLRGVVDIWGPKD